MPESSTLKGKKSGIVPGVIACVFAILGMFTIGTLFIPLAALVALVGTIIAVMNKNMGGIGIAILAWILTVVGLILSPALIAIIGLSF